MLLTIMQLLQPLSSVSAKVDFVSTELGTLTARGTFEGCKALQDDDEPSHFMQIGIEVTSWEGTNPHFNGGLL